MHLRCNTGAPRPSAIAHEHQAQGGPGLIAFRGLCRSFLDVDVQICLHVTRVKLVPAILPATMGRVWKAGSWRVQSGSGRAASLSARSCDDIWGAVVTATCGSTNATAHWAPPARRC